MKKAIYKLLNNEPKIINSNKIILKNKNETIINNDKINNKNIEFIEPLY